MAAAAQCYPAAAARAHGLWAPVAHSASLQCALVVVMLPQPQY